MRTYDLLFLSERKRMWRPSPRLSLAFILSDSTNAPTFTSAGEEPLVEQLARAESARAVPH